MYIVDRKTFIAMPAGTVYQKYGPCFFGPINIKADGCGGSRWFYAVGIDQPDFAEAVDSGAWLDCCDRMEAGERIPTYFGVICPDGLFDSDQLFAIWEPDDLRGLIGQFQTALDAQINPPAQP